MFRVNRTQLARWANWRGAERCPAWLADALELVAWFPVGVTVLCAATFLFGGRCAAWQWWSALAVAVGVEMFRRRNAWRQGLAGCALFLGVLVGIWLAAGVVLTVSLYIDNLSYHLPAIRLLTAGWNPVFQATPETIPGGGTPEAWGLRVWHTLAMPKGPWFFSAAAWFCFREPFALFWPLLALVFLSSACSLWCFFGERPLWIRIVALVALGVTVPGGVSDLVDGVVMLSAVGLLSEMGVALRTGRCRFGAMVPHTFWMMCSKQISLLSCALFLTLFGVLWLWQRREAWRQALGALTLLALALGALWAVVSVSPYWTAWRHYSHPLYPRFSCDETRFPVRNFVGDFGNMNPDARAIGHLGRVVNAYVSEDLAATWYRWRLGQESFEPRQSTWKQGGDLGKASGSPTSRVFRLWFLASVAAVLLLGARHERMLLALPVCALVAVPSEMVGFLRYVPWHSFLPLLAFEVLTRERRRSVLCVAAVAGCFCFLGATGVKCLWAGFRSLVAVDERWAMEALLDKAPPQILYAYDSDNRWRSQEHIASSRSRFPVIGHPLHTGLTNLHLLKVMEPRLAGAQVVILERFLDEQQAFPLIPSNEFRLSFESGKQLHAESLFFANSQIPDRTVRLRNWPRICFKVACFQFPSLLWRKVSRLVFIK